MRSDGRDKYTESTACSELCAVCILQPVALHAVIHLALIWMIEKSVAREIDGWIYVRARVMQMHSFHLQSSAAK